MQKYSPALISAISINQCLPKRRNPEYAHHSFVAGVETADGSGLILLETILMVAQANMMPEIMKSKTYKHTKKLSYNHNRSLYNSRRRDSPYTAAVPPRIAS
jgi:hypothetical protein